MQRNLIETPYSSPIMRKVVPPKTCPPDHLMLPKQVQGGGGGDGFLLPNFLVLSTYVDTSVSLLEPPSSNVCLTLGDLTRGTLEGDCPRGVVDEETTTVGILEGRGGGGEEEERGDSEMVKWECMYNYTCT